jgi:hemoglobin
MTQTAMLAELDAEAAESYATSPFVAVGGAGAVSAVVDEFYLRLLNDPATAGFFTTLVQEDDGLSRLKRHQVLLLTKVLGGPDRYDGRDLGEAHAGLAITPEAYQRVSLYLLTVLHDFKVPMDVLQVADSTLRAVAPAIVNAPSGAAS